MVKCFRWGLISKHRRFCKTQIILFSHQLAFYTVVSFRCVGKELAKLLCALKTIAIVVKRFEKHMEHINVQLACSSGFKWTELQWYKLNCLERRLKLTSSLHWKSKNQIEIPWHQSLRKKSSQVRELWIFSITNKPHKMENTCFC